MSDDVALARSEVESAREKLANATEKAIASWEVTLRSGLGRFAERAVIEQPEHTATIQPADLATLKFNIGQSVDAAVSGVRGAVAGLDIEMLANRASQNATGASFVSADDVLSPLVRTTGDLLSRAGFSIQRFRRSSFDDTYRFSQFDEGTASRLTARELDAAIERYGKAKRSLEAAELEQAKSAARDAWNSAG